MSLTVNGLKIGFLIKLKEAIWGHALPSPMVK